MTMISSLRIERLLVYLACLLVGLVATADAQPRRHDGLNVAEKQSARSAALQALPHRARMNARNDAAQGNGLGSTEAPDREVLLVERYKRSKEEYKLGKGRAAEVYVYEYETNVLKHLVVSMPDGTVETVSEAQGVQPPLNDNELLRALAIAQSDPRVQGRLRTAFTDVTGETLETPDQLHVKAMVFHASSMPEGLSADAQACGLHRCAQLLLFTHDEFALDLLPIVDLSSGKVVQAGGF